MEKSSIFLSRSGGVAAVLGGVMWSASIFLRMNDVVSDSDGVSDILFFATPLLLPLGRFRSLRTEP